MDSLSINNKRGTVTFDNKVFYFDTSNDKIQNELNSLEPEVFTLENRIVKTINSRTEY